MHLTLFSSRCLCEAINQGDVFCSVLFCMQNENTFLVAATTTTRTTSSIRPELTRAEPGSQPQLCRGGAHGAYA